MATTTRGLYLPLTRADLLVPIMASAAATELDRRRVDEHVAAMLEAYGPALADTDEAERVRWVTEALRRSGLEPREMVLAEGARSAPLRARELAEADVAGALERLRLAGRAA